MEMEPKRKEASWLGLVMTSVTGEAMDDGEPLIDPSFLSPSTDQSAWSDALVAIKEVSSEISSFMNALREYQ
jgi:hypothetical protein